MTQYLQNCEISSEYLVSKVNNSLFFLPEVRDSFHELRVRFWSIFLPVSSIKQQYWYLFSPITLKIYNLAFFRLRKSSSNLNTRNSMTKLSIEYSNHRKDDKTYNYNSIYTVQYNYDLKNTRIIN